MPSQQSAPLPGATLLRWHPGSGGPPHARVLSAAAACPQVCLPVYFNEPLSALQKMAEELEYSELLDKVRFQSNAWCHYICSLAAAHVSS